MLQRDGYNRWFGLGAAVLATTILVGGCSGGGASPAATASSPDVWANVDGREIRRDDVEKVYRSNLDPAAPVPSEEEALGLKLNILEELITQNILQAQAKTLGLEPSEADVDKALAERKGSATDEAFNLQLTQRGFTLEDAKNSLRRELAVQKVIEREVTSKVSVTDADITAFYEANRAQFNLPETQYRLAQIVVTPVPEAQVANRMRDDATTPAEAQRKSDMLNERLKGGADFSALAMDYSEDPQSAPRGGDLGFVPVSTLNQLPPEFRAAVLRMQPGNIQTMTVNGGHTILMMLGREDAGQRDLSTASVKDGIREMLTSRSEQVLQNAFLTSLRDEADVTNFLARQIVASGGRLTAAMGGGASGAAAQKP